METINDLIKAKEATYKLLDEKISLEAVKQEGDALRYVKEQTEAICLEAVKQDGYALRYVKEQTEAICLEAVKRNGDALLYVKEDLFKQTKELTVQEIEKLLGFSVKIVK